MLIALAHHVVEVRDLSNNGDPTYSFPTVDQVAYLLHCTTGEYCRVKTLLIFYYLSAILLLSHPLLLSNPFKKQVLTEHALVMKIVLFCVDKSRSWLYHDIISPICIERE